MRAYDRAVLLAVAVGSVLGAAGQLGSAIHPGMYWVVALGVPWLVTAFFAGAMLGDGRRGALAGAAALVVGTLVYYALRVVLGGGFAGRNLTVSEGALVVAGWCAASVAAGLAFGYAGAMWRRGRVFAHILGAAIVSGALVGEALLLMQEWSGRGARLVLTAELAAGLALPVVLTRRRALIVPALALTAVVALLAAGTEDGLRDALRGVGWNGA